MKNYILKISILAFFLLSNFALLAQPTEETPEPNPPIDGYVIWLALVGVVFAFYFFKRRAKTV